MLEDTIDIFLVSTVYIRSVYQCTVLLWHYEYYETHEILIVTVLLYQSLRLLLSTSQKTDTMGYSCDSCQYSCTRSRDNRHNRTRTGEKSFTCESCQYSCTRICNLKQHKLFKHSDEKQVSCNLCLFTFKTKIYLKRHTVKINLLFVTSVTTLVKQVVNWLNIN